MLASSGPPRHTGAAVASNGAGSRGVGLRRLDIEGQGPEFGGVSQVRDGGQCALSRATGSLFMWHLLTTGFPLTVRMPFASGRKKLGHACRLNYAYLAHESAVTFMAKGRRVRGTKGRDPQLGCGVRRSGSVYRA